MAPLTAYHRTPLPPTGVSHAVSCRLFTSPSTPTHSHLITARSNSLSIYSITERGISHLLNHSLHGSITSLSVVQTLQTKRDGKDRILVSYEQAKMSLLEWNDATEGEGEGEGGEFGLVPVSLHTFEKLPQVAEDRSTLIAHDPISRMTVLHLPTNSGGDGTLAVLPWFTEELDLEGLGMDRQGWEQGGSQIPYAPSHLIPLTSLQPSSHPSSLAARSSTLSSQTSSSTANAFLPNSPPPIRNLVSLTFLPGFTEPTLALLYAPDYTWSGRLESLAHNHLVSLVTLSTRQQTQKSSEDGDGSASPTIATLISTSPPLPYSLTNIQPVPVSLGIGSVLLTSANGLLLLDIQGGGRLVGIESNRWFGRDFPPGRPLPIGIERTTSTEAQEGGRREVDERLEGSVITFLADPDQETTGEMDNKALVFCKSGMILQLSIERVGRSVNGMKLEALGEGEGERCEGGASCAVRIGDGRVFVGSEQGHSRLYEVKMEGGNVKKEEGTTRALELTRMEEEEEEDEMDEDDDDIYGDSTKSPTKKHPIPQFDSSQLQGALASLNSLVDTTNGSSSAGSGVRLRLRVIDELESYGSVRSLVMGLVDDTGPAELVGATGAGREAGLTIFHRTLPTVNRRSLPLPTSTNPEYDSNTEQTGLLATDGIWTISLGPRVDQLGGEEVMVGSNQEGTFVYKTVQSEETELVKIEEGFRTVYAAGMGSGDERVLVLVGAGEIRIYDRDLNPLSSIPLSPPIPANTSPRATSTDSYLALHSGSRSSLDSRLFRYDSSSRSLTEVDEARGKGVKIAVWRDVDRKGELIRPTQQSSALEKKNGDSEMQTEGEEEDEDEDLYGTSSKVPKAVGMEIEKEQNSHLKKEDIKRARLSERHVENEEVGNPERDSLVKIDSEGTITIYLLPTMLEVFRSQSVSLLPSVLSDSPSSQPTPIPSSIDEDDLVIDRIQLVTLGPAHSTPDARLHLVIWNTSGTFVLYEAFSAQVPPSSQSSSSSNEEAEEPSPRLGLRFVKTLVHHIPISTPRRKGSSTIDLPPPIRKELVPFTTSHHHGLFITGEEPYWILKGRQGPSRCFESTLKQIYGFSSSLLSSSSSSSSDLATMTWNEGLQLTNIAETVSINEKLPVTKVPKDRTYSYLTFDLDSGCYVAGTNKTNFVAFDEEGVPFFKENVPGLMEPTNWQSTLELLVPGSWQAIDGYEFRQNEFVCTVKTVSLHSKSRASGMKDFIAVGTTVYRGEDLSAKGGIYIFEVVPIVPHPSTPSQSHILKLRFFEDTKSIVGNICDLNGYLFLSMGQKLYARAFEQDEVLIAVGFLDLGVHVTSLTSLKNFLLIGDAMQSVALVAFQEDPYKLVFLGRDYRPSRISSANFLVNEGKVAFVTGDDKGVLRMFEYDPSNIASHAGQRLLCRTEYHAGSESIATMLFAKHLPNEDPKQNGILFGGIDGSLYTLVPVRDAVFRRLQSLQATMSRHVLHFGGLNPRGYRIVKNDTVSRAITKGILDGDLLARFEYLSVDVQTELAVNCGTDVDTVLANLRNLRVYE
ncbi:cleavage/polyadenylation factor CFT1 [Sporobolomyces salmoneus]|uniref:cleavage/polyadenylation factor CFT1 n=1 Tax=Sporobolomyces salmoneus TaxID=183962 RepID=UPI00317DD36F